MQAIRIAEKASLAGRAAASPAKSVGLYRLKTHAETKPRWTVLNEKLFVIILIPWIVLGRRNTIVIIVIMSPSFNV